jgi:hypothetical protein
MQIPTRSSNAKSWREALPIHPAAELFPMMSEPELKALGEDIKKNGLKTSIAIFDSGFDTEGQRYWLLDGRNRLAAMEAVGLAPQLALKDYRRGWAWWTLTWEGAGGDAPQPKYVDAADDDDPYGFVASANIHRRHLTGEAKRDLIGKLIKAAPEKSDRQIAEIVKASPTTVGTVRTEMEAAGDVSKLDTRTDSRGRQQPASKPKHKDPEAKEAARRQVEEEALEKSRREREAVIKDRAAALIERHGEEAIRAIAKSLLAFPIFELPDLLEHLVGVDGAQRVDGEAA